MKRFSSLILALLTMVLMLSIFTSCVEEEPSTGEKEPCTVELILEANAKDTGYKVMGIKECECEIVVIPETFNEKPVVEIATFAFINNQTIKEITIPKTVTKIDQSAFENCTKLEKVIFSEEGTLKTISKNAFRGATALKEINLPNSVTTIQYGAFMNCESLERFVVPSSVKIISQFSFAYNYSLEEIVLPMKLKQIEFYAFCDSSKLERIIYPDSKEQWAKVSLDEFWNQNVPATEIICQTIVPIE